MFGGTADQLKSYNINISPPENVWVQVDEKNGVWFKQVRVLLFTGMMRAMWTGTTLANE